MKKLILLILIPLGLMAQRNDTIVQRVFTNQAVAATSGAITNVGQSFHTMTTVFSDSGGGCAITSATNIALQASADNSSWFTIALMYRFVLLGNANGKMVVRQASGSYPYLRVKIIALDVNCAVTVLYSGNLYGTPKPNLGVLTVLTNSSVGPGATVVLISNTTSTADLAVYGFTAYNSGTTTATITFSCVDGGTSQGVWSFPVFAGTMFVYTSSTNQALSCPAGADLKATSAGVADGTVSFNMNYRYEPSI